MDNKQRDNVIREAATLLPVSEIVEITGLSKQRIHQILNINPNITQAELDEFYARFTPEARSALREKILADALKDSAPQVPAHLRIPEADV